MNYSSTVEERQLRQGSIIQLSDEDNLLPTHIKSHDKFCQESFFIILTQDCDLLCDDFEEEPFIEILWVLQTDKQDGNLLYGKNLRRIQFYIDQESNPTLYEAHAVNRVFLEKENIHKIKKADKTISIETLSMLNQWLSKRYQRDAFPDTFNDRFGNVKNYIKDQLKKYQCFISQIRIRLNNYEELNKDQDYSFLMYFLMKEEDFEDSNKSTDVMEFAQKVETKLNTVEGLNIEEVKTVSESEFTLSDVRETRVWHFYDYLTHKGELKH